MCRSSEVGLVGESVHRPHEEQCQDLESSKQREAFKYIGYFTLIYISNIIGKILHVLCTF